MARVSPALALLSLLCACQEGTPHTSRSEHLSTVPTVPEVARNTTLTIFARDNHSTANTEFHTVLNEYVINHAGSCTNRDGHGGRWKMGWTAMCEKQHAAACQESYPVVSDETRTEVATWKGVNVHLHGLLDWYSCGRWTWGSSWEGADYGDCQSKGEVIPMSGTGQERASVAVGVGYAAKHAEDQIVITPAIFIGAEGPGGAAGLDFSYREQSWGNGYEVRCEYKCDWAGSTEEVVLMEKCWPIGLEDSDETNRMITQHTDLNYDGKWREIGRKECTEDDGDDGTGDDSDDQSDDGPSQDAGGGGGQDAGGGSQDGGSGGNQDGGSGGGQDGGSGGNQDGGSGGNQDGGSGGNQDGGAGSADAAPTPTDGDGGPTSTEDGGVGPGTDGGVNPSDDGGVSTPPDGGPWPHDAGPWPQDAGAPLDGGHPRDGGPTPRDGGITPHPTEPSQPAEP